MGYYKYDFGELNNLSMLDVAERLGHEVKTSGRHKVMLCPFHDDHHPSMVVYEHSVKCYACGKGLGVINFVKEVKNVGVKEACEWLYGQFGKGGEWVETRKCSNDKRKHNASDVPKAKRKRSSLSDLQTIIDRATGHFNIKKQFSPSNELGIKYVFDIDYVVKHMKFDDSFCKCLRRLFNAETVFYVKDMYGIGCFNTDDTMFPIIDSDLRVHNIKIQHYDTNPLSKTFFHKDRGKAWWYGVKYLESHRDAQGVHDVNCYFGEHLISRFPSAVIVLVESPKNAVLGACVWPEYVWVAAGSKGMLSRERLECMRGRKVLVMPDCDAVEEWRAVLSTMQDIATFVISGMVEEFGRIGHKADVGDWVIERIRKHPLSDSS